MNEKSVNLPWRSGSSCVWLFLSVAFLLALPGIARAQVAASIVGNVTDSTGAAVKDAKITVKSLDTGATREATTDDAGDFRFLSLPLGPQEVRAKKTASSRWCAVASIWKWARKQS